MKNVYVLETRTRKIYYNGGGDNGGINIATRFDDASKERISEDAERVKYKRWKFDEMGKLIRV